MVNGNIFESNDWIAGEALRGSLSGLIRSVLGVQGRDLGEIVLPESHPWYLLCKYFDQIHFSRAIPRPDTAAESILK